MFLRPSSDRASGRRSRWLSVRSASILTTAVAIVELALAQELVAVGLLSCESQRATGSLAAQRQNLVCWFAPAEGDIRLNYLGEIVDFGQPLGVSERTSMVWQVLTVSGVTGLLTGSYTNAASPDQIESTLLRGGPEGETYLRIVSFDGRTEPNFVTQVTALSLRPAE
jgi:hypothetical protein